MYTEIYSVLNKNRKACLSTYNRLLKTKGLWCEVQIPVERESIFGLEDLVEYDELVTCRKKLLIFGMFTEGEMGMQSFDSFLDCFVLTPYKERLPLQTQIQVEFVNRKFNFKVDTHRNLSPSVDQQLFIKNMLVAAT